jgi:glycosyltransferase involved in cell wall biosynthesis
MKQIDLLWFGHTKPAWALGEVWLLEPTVEAIHACMQQRLPSSKAAAWLFWDSALGLPQAQHILETTMKAGDLWHAGLRLGMGGLPGLLDFICPNWMLAADPDPNIEATSWRLSWRACLVKTDVLRQMGGISPDFLTGDGAALEFGHRCVSRGVFTRHVPGLIPAEAAVASTPLPLEDALRVVLYRFGRFWSWWALLRAVMCREASASAAVRAWRTVAPSAVPPQPLPYTHRPALPSEALEPARVTVLIPTVDRYPYLCTLLGQLRQQTVPPVDIVVIDQTPVAHRHLDLAQEFSDLPLQIIQQDQAGQCVSRNAGLQLAKGDTILFLDDDDEIQPTLIEDHLRNLHRFGTDVSSGVNDEDGAGPLPEAFTFTRLSDVFPTNNTMVHRRVLERAGLFDLAYNRGQRADGDLGMRVYLSGALMVLNPQISVFHHHAPSGGLRVHKARVVTYASSRRHLTHRQLLSATEMYLCCRYYSRRHLREMIWHSLLGTFSVRGGRGRKLLKAFLSFVCLPHSLWLIGQRYRMAQSLLREFPQIPTLKDAAPDLSRCEIPTVAVG